MFTHPHLASGLARDRQREMSLRRPSSATLRQLRDLVTASRRAEPTQRRMARSLKRSRPAALPS